MVDRKKTPVQNNIILGFLEHRVQLLRYHISLTVSEGRHEFDAYFWSGGRDQSKIQLIDPGKSISNIV